MSNSAFPKVASVVFGVIALLQAYRAFMRMQLKSARRFDSRRELGGSGGGFVHGESERASRAGGAARLCT